MVKIKVVELLKSLTDDEIRLLDKFVRSPIHNRHESVVLLFRYLRNALKRNPDIISAENMFEHLFPGEPFKAQKVHHISSYLLKVIEEFLAWQEWRQNEIDFHINLLESYKRLKCSSLFHQTFDKVQFKHSEITVKNEQFYKQLFHLEKVHFSQMRTESRHHDFRLQELSSAQDIAFVISKLKSACILLSNQSVTKVSYDLGLTATVQEYAEQKKLISIPTVALYYYASKALSNYQDDESFSKLKKLILTRREILNASELYDIHVFAINYGIRRLNSGDKLFMREVFDLYQSGLYAGIFLEKGMLAPRTYSNIVLSGLRLGEFDVIEHFISDYKDKLPEKQREGFFNYNLARLYYEKKDYKAAMPKLLQIETYDVLHNCAARTLLAKMYFELGETESLLSLIKSFKIFLRRKNMHNYHKDPYFNFINIIQKMIGLSDSIKIESLLNLIEDTNMLAAKDWLILQLNSLEKR